MGEIKACMDLDSIMNEEYDIQDDLTFLVQRQIKTSDSDQVPWGDVDVRRFLQWLVAHWPQRLTESDPFLI